MSVMSVGRQRKEVEEEEEEEEEKKEARRLRQIHEAPNHQGHGQAQNAAPGRPNKQLGNDRAMSQLGAAPRWRVETLLTKLPVLCVMSSMYCEVKRPRQRSFVFSCSTWMSK